MVPSCKLIIEAFFPSLLFYDFFPPILSPPFIPKPLRVPRFPPRNLFISKHSVFPGGCCHSFLQTVLFIWQNQGRSALFPPEASLCPYYPPPPFLPAAFLLFLTLPPSQSDLFLFFFSRRLEKPILSFPHRLGWALRPSPHFAWYRGLPLSPPDVFFPGTFFFSLFFTSFFPLPKLFCPFLFGEGFLFASPPHFTSLFFFLRPWSERGPPFTSLRW